MKIFHTLLERSVIFLFVLLFSFVSLYTPQIYTPDVVEAGGVPPTPCFTVVGPCASDNTNTGIMGNTAAVIPANIATSIQTTGSFVLDNVLDGIAWSLAKNIISEMTSSIINWVNSGFKGSPAFLTDMEGFLTQIADRTFGEFLEELGGPFSFICAPFKLDIRVAIAVIYENERANAGQAAPPTCTLSGALANLENFIDGVESFTDGDGWDTWFKITANPAQYTPQGSLMAAQAQAKARLVNSRGQELSLLDFGQGFLSSKVCEAVQGAGSSKEKCTITTPGKVINEALTFQTSAGPRSLIEADEINEIISAVFSQLTQKAITGTLGLLGLSGGTGYTYSGVPFTEQVASSGPTSDPIRLRKLITDSLALERQYASSTEIYQPQLAAYAANITNPTDRRNDAAEASTEALTEYLVIAANIGDLQTLLTDFDAITNNNPAELQSVSELYFTLNLHTEAEVEGAVSVWKALLRD